MTLQPIDASGSQRFTSDGGLHTGDVRGLLSPPSLTLEGPLAVADYIKPVPIKGWPGLYYGKATLREARGPIRREGDFRIAHASRQSGSLVGEQPDLLRLPLLTVSQATPDPTSTPYRMLYADYLTSDVVGMHSFNDDEVLYRATSTSDATMIAVAGHPPALRPYRLMCLRVVDWAGTSYLMAGHISPGTAASALQAITNLTTNPPTYAYVPGAAAVHDLWQLPDGSLMVYDSGHIVMVNTSVAPGAATFADVRASLPYGGYFAGLQALGGGQPLIYAVVPQNSYLMIFDPATPGTAKGNLVGISLDGWTVQNVTTGLPWVTFATVVRDGLMCCDQTSHVLLTGRRTTPMNWLKERYPDTGYTIVCRGHKTDGQRFWWKANAIKSGAATQSWWEEVHFDLLDEENAPISLPCSKPVTLGVNAQTVGAWAGPYFPTTRMLTEYSGTAWYRQKQSSNGQLAYDMRRLPAETTGGESFEASDSMTWPVLQYPGLEGCPMVTVKMTAPYVRHIAQGEASPFDGTAHAYVQMEELLSGMSAKFHAVGRDDRRPDRAFLLNKSWSYGFQPKLTLAQQTGGTTGPFTSNGFPATYDFIAFKDGLGNVVPAQYRNLDAAAVLRRMA